MKNYKKYNLGLLNTLLIPKIYLVLVVFVSNVIASNIMSNSCYITYFHHYTHFWYFLSNLKMDEFFIYFENGAIQI